MFGKKDEPRIDLEFFTIYDSKTQSYDQPTFAINRHDIVRQVINIFKDPSQSNNKYLLNAEDYSIYRIGSYDKTTGLVNACNLEHVANMHELRAIAQPDTKTLGIVPT